MSVEKELNKKYKNTAEQECKEKLVEKGFKVLKKGYPDFLFYKGNKFYCVEVKPENKKRLSVYQIRVMDFLTSKGIVCYKYSCDKGFELWTKERSQKEKNAKTRYYRKQLEKLYE